MFSFLNNCLRCCCYSLTPEQWEILQQDIAVISQDYKSCKNYLISWKKNKHYHYTDSVAREQRVFILQLVITLKQDTGRPLRFIQTYCVIILTIDKLLSTTEMWAINPTLENHQELVVYFPSYT